MSIDAQPRYREVAVVGGGVIGVSWTALFLAHLDDPTFEGLFIAP